MPANAPHLFFSFNVDPIVSSLAWSGDGTLRRFHEQISAYSVYDAAIALRNRFFPRYRSAPNDIAYEFGVLGCLLAFVHSDIPQDVIQEILAGYETIDYRDMLEGGKNAQYRRALTASREIAELTHLGRAITHAQGPDFPASSRTASRIGIGFTTWQLQEASIVPFTDLVCREIQDI